MYDMEQITSGLKNPKILARVLNRKVSTSLSPLIRPPAKVFKRDWDNLIILDACRYDTIREYDFDYGELEWCWSGGSNSIEYLKYNVQGAGLDDVVWVTANPHVRRFSDDIYKVVDVWDSDWNEEYQTVLPESMVNVARRAATEHPRKRLVVHFMQPHYPFIGSVGREQLPDHRTFTGNGLRENQDEAGRDIWSYLEAGVVGEERVWEAYRENLDIVLPPASELARELQGKSVITADHGNAFGKHDFPIPLRIYGHPGERRVKSLIKVPWVMFQDDDRKEIESGEIVRHDSGEVDGVEKKLQQLGYV